MSSFGDWVGREETAEDWVSASALDRWSATFDRGDPPFEEGDPVPTLAHWLLFLPSAPQSSLGSDGHPMRGGFLPPVHDLPRRMWAGGRVSFLRPLTTGAHVTRRSTIAAVKEKTGGSGRLIFVTVRHEIAERGNPAAIVEEHDIVYRGLGGAAVKATETVADHAAWHRTVTPDAPLLFRYSALTFNGHRIHYDLDYARGIEGYPGLVVHGPLIATLLADLVNRNLPKVPLQKFSFRAFSPLFAGDPMTVNAAPASEDGRIKLWASNKAGGLAMMAEACLLGDGHR
ncbi:3-methylfumaryl-CoA hydratase [Rhodoligotrophos appendicifer]|nr:MaoC family dehydratase N-terminal domain-containing protein [Rhodoligotrophos appendicifer]